MVSHVSLLAFCPFTMQQPDHFTASQYMNELTFSYLMICTVCLSIPHSVNSKQKFISFYSCQNHYDSPLKGLAKKLPSLLSFVKPTSKYQTDLVHEVGTHCTFDSMTNPFSDAGKVYKTKVHLMANCTKILTT